MRETDNFPSSRSRIYALLRGNTLEEMQEAMALLLALVESKYDPDEENDPLSEILETDPEEEEIADLPILDEAIRKHLPDLPASILIDIFTFTLQNVYHNYNACLLVTEEAIKRKDVNIQLEFVKQFEKACSEYEPGHRYYTDTVFDALIVKYFPRFESRALYRLLSNTSHDGLKNDEIDALFLPALANTTNEGLQKKIIAVFFSYRREFLLYLGLEYFDKLIRAMRKSLSAFLNVTIDESLEDAEDADRLTVLLQQSEIDLKALIRLLPKLGEGEYNASKREITQALTEAPISEALLVQLTEAVWNIGRDKLLAKVLFYHRHNSGQPEKILDFCEGKLAENYRRVASILNLLIELSHKEASGTKLLPRYRDFLVQKCNLDHNAIYLSELKVLVNEYLEDKNDITLGEIEKVWVEIEGEINFVELEMYLWTALNNGKFQKVMNIFSLLFPGVRETSEERIISHVTVAAVVARNYELFNRILKIVNLRSITEPLLAFNLACGGAVFNLRDVLLKYARLAIELGKSPEEFMEDSDFEVYWENSEFLQAIGL